MSAERLRQAREQLRLEFIEYVEDLAMGASDSDDMVIVPPMVWERRTPL